MSLSMGERARPTRRVDDPARPNPRRAHLTRDLGMEGERVEKDLNLE